MPEPPRSRAARYAAASALVRLVAAYGETPEFVLLGGLVPDLLCSGAVHRHIGTTDIDVQLDCAIQDGSASCARLERALLECGFRSSRESAWRWRRETDSGVVKIEFLADQADVPGEAEIRFDGCESLGAVNLAGTGYAARDWRVLPFIAGDGNDAVEIRVATLPAYLLAKAHAATGRGATKDWYDIAYVVLHNDQKGPVAAASQIIEAFGRDLPGLTVTALHELGANFANDRAQGSVAYSCTMKDLYPELDVDILANDAVAGIAAFLGELHIS